MSEGKKNIEIDDLFRSRLENSELIPGAGAGKSLMRRLALREFLRFSLSHINIYYVGSVIVTGAAAVLLLTTSPSAGTNETIQAPPDKIITKNSSTPINQTVSLQQGRGIHDTNSIPANKTSEETRQKVSSGEISLQNPRENTSTAALSSVRTDSLLKNSQVKEEVAQGSVSRMTLQKKISSSFNVSVTSGCSPLKVRFRNTSVAYDSCYWTFGDGGFSTSDNPDWIFDMEGEYRVTLRVLGRDGSQSVSSDLIDVYSRPEARFEIDPANIIIPDDEVHFQNTSTDAIRCRWEFGDGNVSDAWEPVHKYRRFDNFNIKLVVWSEHGCADSAVILDAFAGSGSYIRFPNAFIPNPDGPTGGNYSQKSDEAAQIFHPVTTGVSEYQLRIFSKVGMLIFESNDISIGWDGYHKGQLCDPGVYVWKVRGTYKNGEPFVKMGDVTLLKN